MAKRRYVYLIIKRDTLANINAGKWYLHKCVSNASIAKAFCKSIKWRDTRPFEFCWRQVEVLGENVLDKENL